MKLTIQLTNDGEEYQAQCPELEICCYGDSSEEAVRRLKNVLTFYSSTARELGFNVESFIS